MQIDNVLEQLETDGHYDLAAFLTSHLEGLKGEVERAVKEIQFQVNRNDKQNELNKKLVDENMELRAEVERYRTALEEIGLGEAPKYTLIAFLRYREIARKALEGSHETPIDTTRHGEDPMTGDRW